MDLNEARVKTDVSRCMNDVFLVKWSKMKPVDILVSAFQCPCDTVSAVALTFVCVHRLL